MKKKLLTSIMFISIVGCDNINSESSIVQNQESDIRSSRDMIFSNRYYYEVDHFYDKYNPSVYTPSESVGKLPLNIDIEDNSSIIPLDDLSSYNSGIDSQDIIQEQNILNSDPIITPVAPPFCLSSHSIHNTEDDTNPDIENTLIEEDNDTNHENNITEPIEIEIINSTADQESSTDDASELSDNPKNNIYKQNQSDLSYTENEGTVTNDNNLMSDDDEVEPLPEPYNSTAMNMGAFFLPYFNSATNAALGSIKKIGTKIKTNMTMGLRSISNKYNEANEWYMQYRLPEKIDLKKFKKKDITRMVKVIDRVYEIQKAEGIVDKVYNIFTNMMGSYSEDEPGNDIFSVDDIQEGAVMHWFGEGGVIEMQDGSIEICFRGTHTYSDIYTDLYSSIVDSTHAGFQSKYDSLKDKIYGIISKIQKKHSVSTTNNKKDLKINIYGHSLGGGISKISAMDLKDNGYQNINVFTIGCPEPFGLDKKNEYLKCLGSNTLNLVTTNEIISNLGAGGIWRTNPNSVIIPSTTWTPHILDSYHSSLDYLFAHLPNID